MVHLEQLAALRSGPYRGRGGAAALAAALGVKPETVKAWRLGIRQPSYDSRQRIAALWQACCGGKQ
jgi:hypothetical protein